MPEVITGHAESPTVIPKRPTIYALAALHQGKWTLSYAGMNREWIEGSQQPIHAGSSLVVIPGEGEGEWGEKTLECLANLIAARRALDLDMDAGNLAWHHHANAALDDNHHAAEAVRRALRSVGSTKTMSEYAGRTPLEQAAVEILEVIEHHAIEPDGAYSRINTTELTQAAARLEDELKKAKVI